MKILIISNLFPPVILGGYEILCAQVTNFLQQQGHDVYVLTSDFGQAEENPWISRRLTLFLPFDQQGRIPRMKRLRAAKHNYLSTKRYIAEVQPDVVFVWSLLRLTPSPIRSAIDSHIPVVCTFNDENIAGYLPGSFSFIPKKFLRWITDRMIMPQITLHNINLPYTTCISRLLKENLLSKGMNIASSRVIYQGIPLERFPIKPNSGVMGTPVKLLYTGQLHPYKGVHTILSALEILKQDHHLPEFFLTIAGKGPKEYTDSLQRQILENRLPAQCIGSAAYDEMPMLYRSHDIFIFPSIWQEPFGLTHLEAMASGIPVISTVHGGQGEFLKDGENCLTFPAQDEQILASQIKRLMKDPGLFSLLAEEGRTTVEQQFSFSRYAGELEGLLFEASGHSGDITN